MLIIQDVRQSLEILTGKKNIVIILRNIVQNFLIIIILMGISKTLTSILILVLFPSILISNWWYRTKINLQNKK